jgi:glycosyltransferase involved in cell wall biosynthesis
MGHNAALVNTVSCFGGADMAARLGIPFVWAIHESWTPKSYWEVVFPPDYLDRDVRARAEWALGQANAVVFESEATRRQYLGHVAPTRARVVPYGIRSAAVDRFMAQSSREVVRARLGFKADDHVLLLMGTIEPRKAQSLITQAFARVTKLYPQSKLVLVGDMKNRYSEAVRELTERLGVADRVRIVPIVKDTYSWYRAADVLVCASDIESLPRSVLEAMCFGVPILATNVFGLSELLADGENGFLFEPRDVGRAANALDRVLGLDPEELRRVGESGRSTVRDLHDSIGYATEITSMLKDALGIAD